ncbi:MAG: nuclear transport factor 2 family protein [Bacteroidota bacterium]|nr:nuclear transport factor 2 family protein [Bacteroidota bacterium]
MVYILLIHITLLNLINLEKEQINKVLDKLHKYASEANGKQYFELFNEQAVFHGTDLNERWSIDEFKKYAQNRFDTGTGWTYTSLERNIFINSSNTTAWFDEIVINEKYGKFRGTGVLSKVDGMWKIDQYNLLFPIPNDLLLKYTKEVKEYLKNN